MFTFLNQTHPKRACPLLLASFLPGRHDVEPAEEFGSHELSLFFFPPLLIPEIQTLQAQGDGVSFRPPAPPHFSWKLLPPSPSTAV